jgi:hypothetical protein
VTKRERTERHVPAGSAIPTVSDWGNYHADLDENWAHDQYCGRSNEEMQRYIRNSPIEAASDLRFMPDVPFRYYMLGYRDFVMSGQFEPLQVGRRELFSKSDRAKTGKAAPIYCPDYAGSNRCR